MGGWRNTTASGISGDLKRSLFHTSRLIFSVTIARYSQSQLQPVKSEPKTLLQAARQDYKSQTIQSTKLSPLTTKSRNNQTSLAYAQGRATPRTEMV